MKKVLFTLALGLGFAINVLPQPVAQVTPETVGMDSCRLAYADTVILDAIGKQHIPGAVLAVVHKNHLVYLKAYGNKQVYPDTAAMDVNTIFDMASVSKSMSTAISAMVLVERGKIRLLDRVKEYIPRFNGWKDEKGNETDIRIVDLMTHTSGLPPYAPVAGLKEKYGAPNPDGLIEYISTCKRDFKPKTDFQYSCLNYITLQRIIETVSGENLRDFAKKNIFDLLGMAHTDYNPPKEWYPSIAPATKQEDGSVLLGVVHDPLARVMNGGISGNAGVFSDANDMAILAATLLNNGEYKGRRLLSPLGVKTMRIVPSSVSEFGRTPGWDVYSPYASNNGDLLGPNTYGHTGYTGTSIVLDPDNDIAVILLTNRVHPDDGGESVRLRSLVANAVAASVDAATTPQFHAYYYKRVAEFDQDKPIRKNDIVFIGNSITEGCDWAELLGKKNIRNRGISGDLTTGIYHRLHQILPGQPRKIFLMAGINDVSHDLSSDQIIESISKIIAQIQLESPNTKIYLQSILPINESFGRYKRLDGKTNMIPQINKGLEQLAKDNDIIYIDLFPSFVQKGTNSLKPEMTNDGLHLKPEAYKIWAKILKRYL